MGKVGQWGDYIDESVKAEGYYYAVQSNTIQIKTATNAKGALGFKVYDAETGELVSFSNSYSIELPMSMAGKNLKIVAAQADGTDYEIPNVEESDDEAMQKEALSALIARTIKYAFTTEGTDVGYYYRNVVEEINSLRDRADRAVEKNDTSEHSYREWIDLIKEAEKAIEATPNAFVRIENDDIHKLENIAGFNYLCNDNAGVKGVKSINNIQDKNKGLWVVESTGETNYYYIKDNNGNYINDVSLNIGVYCNGKSKEDAVVFEVIYNSDCSLSFKTKESNLFLALNDDDIAVGTEAQNLNATWIVTIFEKKNTAIELVEEENKDAEIFDLQGRRITEPGKGVYIKNGKKVIY